MVPGTFFCKFYEFVAAPSAPLDLSPIVGALSCSYDGGGDEKALIPLCHPMCVMCGSRRKCDSLAIKNNQKKERIVDCALKGTVHPGVVLSVF